MRLTILNTGTVPVPIASNDEGGWAAILPPGESVDIDKDKSDVIIIGDKPGFLEEVKGAFETLFEFLGDLITAWKTKVGAQDGDDALLITVTLTNHGEHPIRVLLGSNVDDVTLDTQATFEASSVNYIELREYGG